MKNTRFTFCILSLIAILAGGCVAPKPLSDPMSGWTRLPDRDQPDRNPKLEKSFKEDYQSYVHSLQAEGYFIDGNIFFFQNGSGQLAVLIEFSPINNTPPSEQLAHVLIYDKNNKRIKVIKYKTGWYSY
jgi:hypothetical protein